MKIESFEEFRNLNAKPVEIVETTITEDIVETLEVIACAIVVIPVALVVVPVAAFLIFHN